jgi:hypothetical protein
LDTSHDCWVGSYTNFNWWRLHLAHVAGYAIKEHADVPFFTIDLPWQMFTEDNSIGDWSKGPVVEDPLLYLLVHSDTGGVIHPEEGRHLAARLEEMVPDLTVVGGPDLAERMERAIPHLTAQRMTDEWLLKATKRFINGLRVAAEAHEDVEFF